MKPIAFENALGPPVPPAALCIVPSTFARALSIFADGPLILSMSSNIHWSFSMRWLLGYFFLFAA
jgi:hypothetical protein